MNPADLVIERVESVGGVLAVDGEDIRCRLPEDAIGLLDDLRTHKAEVLALLKKRETVPTMPEGVHPVRWQPKPAPVILTQYAVVNDVVKFIEMTLLELRAALGGRWWLAGHRTPRELVDRLEQCGVIVRLNRGQDEDQNG